VLTGALLLSKTVSVWGLKFERIRVSSITQSKAQQRQEQPLTSLRRWEWTPQRSIGNKDAGRETPIPDDNVRSTKHTSGSHLNRQYHDKMFSKEFVMRTAILVQQFALFVLYKQVETKCQLDATEVFIADLIACSTCFGHHYAHHQELKSIIQWLLPVVFRATTGSNHCTLLLSSWWWA